MSRASTRRDSGYAMAALLVALAVIGVIISVALPAWRTILQREKEEELIFRGRQYARAIQLYQRKVANAFPPSVDVLVEQRYLRKKYTDPVNGNAEFEILYQGTLAQRRAALAGGRGAAAAGTATVPASTGTSGQLTTQGSAFGSQAAGPRGGVVGVASKSTAKSLRIYDGRTVYNEWQFVWTPQQPARTGPAGSPGPGQRGLQPGQRGRGAGPQTPQGPQRGRGPGGLGSPFSRPPG
jgi:type II secretory pathway pseudopilin PulG